MKLSKSLLIDIAIVLVGAAGALFFSYLFVRDVNATLTRQEEMPVGTITFRYNIAQRRFNNRLVWDRLRNDSPIYNGDIIRTDNLSEVTVSFDHGEAISLFSNTLLQVFIDPGGDNRIDFSGGEVIINTIEPSNLQPVAERRRFSQNQGTGRRRTSENEERTGTERGGTERGERSFVINTGDQRVRVERGSAVRFASLDDGDIELTINEGSVVLEEAPQEEQSASQRRRRNQENTEISIFSERTGADRTRRSENNDESAVSDRTGTERTERAANSDRTRNTERAGTERTGSAGTDDTERTRRAIVINTGEQRIRTERGSSLRLDSQDGELEISIHEGTAVLESTVTDETLAVETGRRVRINSRRGSEEATELSELVIETIEPEETVRTRRERTEPRQDTAQNNTESNRTDRLDRTERTDRTDRNNTETEREPRVRQRELLPAPRNRIPLDQHTITSQMIMESQTRSIDFSWDSVNGANGYILTIFRDNEGFRSTVLQTQVLTENKYTVDNLRQLSRGTLYWQVEAVRVSESGDIDQRGRLQENLLIIDIQRRER